MSDFSTFECAPGIRLHARRDDRFTATTLLAYQQRPLDAQAADTAILPGLLKAGTRRLPSIPLLARECQQLWGTSLDASVSRAADRQLLVFRCEAPEGRFVPSDDPLPGALRLLTELIRDPVLDAGGRFPADAVARERVNLVNAIRGRRDDKAGWAGERCGVETFRGEGYAWHEWGELADATALDPARVTDRFRGLLATAPLDVYVVGRFEPAEAYDVIGRAFAWPRQPGPPLPAPAPAPPRGGPVREMVERDQLEQGKLVLGFRSGVQRGDPLVPAAVVFATVLGGTSVSRLFKTVRERHALAYYCSAAYDPASGALFAAAGIDPAAYPRVVAMIREAARQLADEGPGADELRQAQARLAARLRQAADTPAALAAQHFAEHVAGHVRSTAERLAAMAAVTPDDVRAAGARFALDTVFFLAPEGATVGSAT
jgi:predicted Zn-dependent peptidase